MAGRRRAWLDHHAGRSIPAAGISNGLRGASITTRHSGSRCAARGVPCRQWSALRAISEPDRQLRVKNPVIDGGVTAMPATKPVRKDRFGEAAQRVAVADARFRKTSTAGQSKEAEESQRRDASRRAALSRHLCPSSISPSPAKPKLGRSRQCSTRRITKAPASSGARSR